jgi:hypothetical protein
LKADGFVNSFVISAFSYSLFIKLNSRLEKSKCHFFFSNIVVSIIYFFLLYFVNYLPSPSPTQVSYDAFF